MAAPTLDIKIETRELAAALKQLATATRKDFATVVQQNARLVSWNLAHNTQPWGMKLAEKKTGEAAVMRDIGKVFKPATAIFKAIRATDSKLAKAWYSLVKDGKFSAAERILKATDLLDRNAEIGPIEDRHHRDSRGSRGRVHRHRAAQIIPDARELREYQKKITARVGFAKAGWITAGMKVGNVTKVPAWIKRHQGAAPGAARDNSRDMFSPHITLSNQVRYLPRIMSESDVAHALRLQREKMLAHIQHVLSKAGSKAGFRVTGHQGQPLPLAA